MEGTVREGAYKSCPDLNPNGSGPGRARHSRSAFVPIAGHSVFKASWYFLGEFLGFCSFLYLPFLLQQSRGPNHSYRRALRT